MSVESDSIAEKKLFRPHTIKMIPKRSTHLINLHKHGRASLRVLRRCEEGGDLYKLYNSLYKAGTD